MRNGKRFDDDIANLKTRAGLKQVAVEFCFKAEFKSVFRIAIAIDRNVQFRGDAFESADVVAVFVRDEDGGQVFRRAADGGKALTDLTRRKASIHEHAAIFRFHVGTIAGGTAAQNSKFDGHSRKS